MLNQKKPENPELKAKLTPQQYEVTQCSATEPPFQNTFWNNHERRDLRRHRVRLEPLFSSTDKFDSGTGWPSFVQPIVKENVVEHADHTYGMRRVEARSAQGDSHLGHVFPGRTGTHRPAATASTRRRSASIPKAKHSRAKDTASFCSSSAEVRSERASRKRHACRRLLLVHQTRRPVPSS